MPRRVTVRRTPQPLVTSEAYVAGSGYGGCTPRSTASGKAPQWASRRSGWSRAPVHTRLRCGFDSPRCVHWYPAIPVIAGRVSPRRTAPLSTHWTQSPSREAWSSALTHPPSSTRTQLTACDYARTQAACGRYEGGPGAPVLSRRTDSTAGNRGGAREDAHDRHRQPFTAPTVIPAMTCFWNKA